MESTKNQRIKVRPVFDTGQGDFDERYSIFLKKDEEFLAQFNLLPCPFCGHSEHDFIETNRVDKRKVNKLGKTHKGISITHQVECQYCGATASKGYTYPEGDALTDDMIAESYDAAALAWNSRAAISEKAFELVNKLITSAIQGVNELPASKGGL